MAKLSFLLLLLLLLFCLTIAYAQQKEGEAEKELHRCERICKTQQRFRQEQCEKQCQERYRERKQQEQEQERGREDPRREYQQCMQQCGHEAKGQKEQRQCEHRCEDRYREREPEWEREGQGSREKQQQEEENPYYISQQQFKTVYGSQWGSLRTLERFSKRSELLRGIDGFRIALIETGPNTFTVPSHWDAESVVLVLQGQGRINLIREDRKESHDIKQGDFLRVLAGTMVYMINKDNRETLRLLNLVIPVSTPGQFEVFFGAGGQNPKTYYTEFGREIMQAAFDVEWERLQRIWQHQKGAVVKASREQIEGMSKQSEESIWPFATQPRKPSNLFSKTPSHSNRYGSLHEAGPQEHDDLRKLDIALSYANISSRGMHGPLYNSQATKISFIVRGEGHFRLVCPHLATASQEREGREGSKEGSQWHHQQEQAGRPIHYTAVDAYVSAGDVVVLPAGHPFVVIASPEENHNLEVACFEINARDNDKIQLAGRNNALKKLESEAKALSSGTSAREVDEVLNKQKYSMFYPAPSGAQRERGSDNYWSII